MDETSQRHEKKEKEKERLKMIENKNFLLKKLKNIYLL
jgi:hypothetical protein